MTLTARQCLHTIRMGKLIMYANITLGLSIKVLEWNRLLATQKEYVASGVSKTLNSKHLDNCATDLVIVKNGTPQWDKELYRNMGMYWEGMGAGANWGGRFGETPTELGWDCGHFESADV